MVAEIWGHDVTPQVGRYIKPDGWRFGELLQKGDNFSTFRLPTGSKFGVTSLAVEIETTGRTLQRREGEGGWVRVKITFVGDGEPDTVVRGYMKVWS